MTNDRTPLLADKQHGSHEGFRVRDLQTQSHQVSGSTHFCIICGGYQSRSRGEAQRYPPCQIVEPEDFTPRQRNCMCMLGGTPIVLARVSVGGAKITLYIKRITSNRPIFPYSRG